MTNLILASALFVVLLAMYAARSLFKSTTVYEYEKGLLYKKGHFVKLLDAGQYYYWSRSETIVHVDTRKQILILSGQDILTRDNVNIKISIVGFYEVLDPVKSIISHTSFLLALHNLAQVELRKIIGNLTIDEVLDKKNSLDAAFQCAIEPYGTELGLGLSQFALKDFLLPANLKRAFAGLLEAQKEAQRQLEKARGEQAVLRSLANSSKMFEDNPMLMQARLIQALSSGNNSIVFKADEGLTIKPTPKA